MNESLPVREVLPELLEALKKHKTALLEAAPGAGKSTLVPPAVLQSGLAAGKKIYLLEPRRLAARSLAYTISSLLGEKTGQRCGYRVHRDSSVSEETVIEVITEGVMLRILQEDAALEEGAMVIFDEFHQRNLLSDLLMTLLLEVRDTLRDDLMLLFMSATPDCESLETLIPGIPVIRSAGRQYPVDIEYAPFLQPPRGGSFFIGTPPISLFCQALQETHGDLLVFLPGEGEIRQWQQKLQEAELPDSPQVEVLFGRMSLKNQNRVIQPRKSRQRRIILSTDIAETSLTISGITAVIDSGLTRRPRYQPSSGLTLLHTEEISLAAAKQRAGRAGRMEAGRAYRLWDKKAETLRDSQTPPEIAHADLSPLVLELARWGSTDPSMRQWMTAPPASAWKGACELMQMLGALDDTLKLTPAGTEMVRLPVHPRISALLRYGNKKNCLPGAVLLAAFLEQRDFLPSKSGSDLMLRLDYMTRSSTYQGSYGPQVKRIREEAEHLFLVLGNALSRETGQGNKQRFRDVKSEILSSQLTEHVSALTAMAYPDRIGFRIDDRVYQLSGGGRVLLAPGDPLAIHPFIVAAHCGGNPERQKLFLGISIQKKELEDLFQQVLIHETQGFWDPRACKIRSETRTRLGQLTLKVQANSCPDADETAEILKQAILKSGIECLPWNKESRRLFERLCFCAKQKHTRHMNWPDLSEAGLAENVSHWLVPFFKNGKITGSLCQALMALLDWDQQKILEQIAPDHYRSALGNRRKIEYGEGDPYIPIPLQEMYGSKSSPMLGEKPLILHLLNPAGRPVQITSDLASFWKNQWPVVRSELKGRYPKHYWPENPSEAKPSLKTGKKRPE